LSRFAVLLLVLIIALLSVPLITRDPLAEGGLTPNETSVLALVNGTEAFSYDKHLESIALSHYAFRAAGSVGANETAGWISDQFKKEAFQFTTWDLRSKPQLVMDDDGDNSTVSDQIKIDSFQCLHYSMPANVFADLAVLPLPSAADHTQIGVNPIGTLWDSIDTRDKVVLTGREIRMDNRWQQAFSNKLHAQTPKAVIYTWWYDWMSFVPDFFSSAGGRPVTPFGHYYWDLRIGAGFVNYDDGLLIRNREASLNVSAKVVIDAVVSIGPHYNVVGKLTGYVEPDKLVIVCGHYDTVMCAGFCDNGAGTSGVIELARVFTEAAKKGLYYPKYSILFIGLTAEEIGLVGSIEYVAQHKAAMENITAVVNLDCIGSDLMEVTQTDPDHGIDLDQIALNAANDLNVTVSPIGRDQSDEAAFIYPPNGDAILMYWWDMSLNMGDAHPIGSSSMLSSSPLFYQDLWDSGSPGWIHTSNDNSTSTTTLNWVKPDHLEAHIKVTTLTLMRIMPQSSLNTDLNKDGIVNIIDIAIVAKAYGSKPGDASWNEAADLDKDGSVDIVDVSMVARDYGKKV
jgi:hypothetical protein